LRVYYNDAPLQKYFIVDFICFDLDDATEFVSVIQNRQSAMIGCIEEVAYIHNFIKKDEIEAATEKYGKSKYGAYLSKLV